MAQVFVGTAVLALVGGWVFHHVPDFCSLEPCQALQTAGLYLPSFGLGLWDDAVWLLLASIAITALFGIVGSLTVFEKDEGDRGNSGQKPA